MTGANDRWATKRTGDLTEDGTLVGDATGKDSIVGRDPVRDDHEKGGVIE